MRIKSEVEKSPIRLSRIFATQQKCGVFCLFFFPFLDILSLLKCTFSPKLSCCGQMLDVSTTICASSQCPEFRSKAHLRIRKCVGSVANLASIKVHFIVIGCIKTIPMYSIESVFPSSHVQTKPSPVLSVWDSSCCTRRPQSRTCSPRTMCEENS